MKKLRIHCIQHVPYEGPGAVLDWAEVNGAAVSYSHLYKGHALPDLQTLDMLLVMGGPMGIYDVKDFPWLPDEKIFIRQCIDHGKIVLGICLGAQLIADVLGARVFPNAQKEIGWFPIQLDDTMQQILELNEASAVVFHWHGDTFDLPLGAIHLAKSEACQNQAFLFAEKVMGLQFHLETTPDSLRLMINNGLDELKTAGEFVDSETQMFNGVKYVHGNNLILFRVLDYLSRL
ncbi:type 1 glutamine amidotransferase [Geofilum sp. OHC36d9]|uniref:type 1 glutamine amidotransferase n=1 Tax=Geofilum sp. OHC36d9 TaxID=3458413 RepID=UPI004034BD8E